MAEAAARSRTRSVADSALELVLPARCAGCGAWAGPCCSRCLRVFGPPRERDPASLTDVPAYAAARYHGVARELVLAYKERGRRDLAGPLGFELAEALTYLPEVTPDTGGTRWLVPAPSRGSVARLRGGSHTRALAGECARGLTRAGYAAAVAPALRMRRGVRDTVGLDREQRARNLAGGVGVVPGGLPQPRARVVLLDDVLTTGATAAACVAALGSAGYVVTAVLTLTAAC